MKNFNLARFRSVEGLNRLYETNSIIQSNLDYIEDKVNSGQWTKDYDSIQLFEYMDSLVDKELANEQLWEEVTTKQKLLVVKESYNSNVEFATRLNNLKSQSDEFLASMSEVNVAKWKWSKKAKRIYLIEFIMFLILSVISTKLTNDSFLTILWGSVFFGTEVISLSDSQRIVFTGFLKLAFMFSFLSTLAGLISLNLVVAACSSIGMIANYLLLKEGNLDKESYVAGKVYAEREKGPQNLSLLLSYDLPLDYLLEVVNLNKDKNTKFQTTNEEENQFKEYIDDTLEKIDLIRKRPKLF